MSKNGMPAFGKTAHYVSLSSMPDRKTEYTTTFQYLTGGLNIYSPDYNLKTTESPDMENMKWQDGTLCSRKGQYYLNDSTARGTGYACYNGTFWGKAFFHIGNKIYYGTLGENMTLTELCDLSSMYTGYVPRRGTFLRYGDYLVYKAPGVFVKIGYNGTTFTVSDVSLNAYTPITYINASWQNGSGDSYQPENRLSAKKTIWFNAGTNEVEQKFSGDGTTTDFTITVTDFVYVSDVTVNGATNGNWSVTGTTLHFYTAPVAGTNNIVVKCQCAVKTYTLPVTPDSIVEVKVDGTVTSAYTLSGATLTFTTAPTVTVPFTSNTIHVTYSKANPDALASIMDCPYAIVYGGEQEMCMVVGGCRAQPNAYFWNGNNVAMDISYWPMEQYNLGGDTEDEITGFGKQQGLLVIFKRHSIGKSEMEFTTIESDDNARVYIAMNYTSINSKTGCDLPWTIQLIENNLVFCNTEQGIHIILDSSAAQENNVMHISQKVNGSDSREGLLRKVRNATNVSSCDDTNRYWLVVDGYAYVWDYVLSEYSDPSFFYWTGISGVSYIEDNETIYHLDRNGRVSGFSAAFTDYGAAFTRRYQFATQIFSTYDRLKWITGAILSFRTDTDLNCSLTYLTDYERRRDLTDIVSRSWRLVPRNLMWRDLHVTPFAAVFRRRPGCRHIRHFSMVLECTEAGYDMPILSAQILYKYEGRDR